MKYLDLIQQLDNKSSQERLDIIKNQLNILEVNYDTQIYSTGINLVIDLGQANKRIGVSSHFDRVENSGGANDNASAIAVCLDIIKKFKEQQNHNLGLRVFFFDEEETGLKGSSAYVNKYGLSDLLGLINMELVGLGDKFALWPLNEKANGQVLSAFETVTRERKIPTARFDKIVTNTADHVPFQKAGLNDSFTITCISDKDIEAAMKYYKALESNADHRILFEILSKAPIFEHYHRPTDTFEKLSEESLLMTSDTIWETIEII